MPHRFAACVLGAVLLGAAAAPPSLADPIAFIDIQPAEGSAAVRLAALQVVRIGRVEGRTVIDTAAWVQQHTSEPAEALARRLAAAGLRLIPLTDLSGARIFLAADRVVLVRAANERHAAGARASVVMVGLRFGTDVAVREPVDAVMAALHGRSTEAALAR